MNTWQDFIRFAHPDEQTIFRATYIKKSGEISLKEIPRSHIDVENRDQCVYFNPCPGGIKTSQIDRYPMFYVDLDPPKDLTESDIDRFKEDCRSRIEEFQLEPTFVVQTRRGYHVYWCLTETMVGYQNSGVSLLWINIQQRLTSHFQGDPHLCSPHQPIRLPFTMHRKDPDNPFRVSVDSFSGRRYSLEEIQNATMDIPVDVSLFPQKSCKSSIQTSDDSPPLTSFLDMRNQMIRAILLDKPEIICDALSYPPKLVDTREELHHYLTHVVDLGEFLGVSGKKFCCPIHGERRPSASISLLDTEEQFYKCFSCGVRGNLRSITQHIHGKSAYKVTRFLMTALNVELRDTPWQQEWRENLQMIKDMVGSEIPRYETLSRILRRKDLDLLKHLVDEAMRNLHGEEIVSLRTGRPIFFASFGHLAKLCGIRDSSSIGKRLIVLALHRLIRRVPDDEIPEELLFEAKSRRKRNGGIPTKNRVTYFEIPELTPELLQAAEERALIATGAGLTRGGFSREAILRTYGPEIAYEVYEQGDIEFNAKNETCQRQMREFIESRLREKGFCYEPELLSEMLWRWKAEKIKGGKRLFKGLLPELLRENGWHVVRMTNRLRERFGIADDRGSVGAIVPI